MRQVVEVFLQPHTSVDILRCSQFLLLGLSVFIAILLGASYISFSYLDIIFLIGVIGDSGGTGVLFLGSRSPNMRGATTSLVNAFAASVAYCGSLSILDGLG